MNFRHHNAHENITLAAMSSSNKVGEILAYAFLHYPLMKYAFEGKSEAQRTDSLNHLYTRCTSASIKYGGVITTENSRGALIWLSGKNFPLGLWREIKSGMGTIPFNLGAKATLRLVNHDTVPEGWIRKNAGEKMGYIWCIGVNFNERGKGYSRKLIDESISQMRAQGMNEFWLKTEDLKNVIIYEKLGFELAHEMMIKSSGLRSWIFRKR